MITFLIILQLSAIGVSYATPSCSELHKSQLASLTERMNRVLSTLYTPIAPKAETNATPPAPVISTASATDQASFPNNAYYPHPTYTIPVPQVLYVSPSQYIPPPVPLITPAPVEPSVLKPFKFPIIQPFEYAYPGSMDVMSPWSNFNDRLNINPYTQYQLPQFPPIPAPYQPLPYPPPYSYPEYPVYPKIPSYPPYQLPPPVYTPPPTPFPSPALYHKSSDMPLPPYYF